ncbi:hypothetical protein SRHO_G00075290 [Serrasalmus rhombeus]
MLCGKSSGKERQNYDPLSESRKWRVVLSRDGFDSSCMSLAFRAEGAPFERVYLCCSYVKSDPAAAPFALVELRPLKRMIEEGGRTGKTMAEKRQIFTEMRSQNFDMIRLSTYRTACKLRFVQKKCNLHLMDVWNMIEAFRDNGLNTLDHNTELSVSRLETIISSIYYQLNKRLPTTHQINVQQSINLLFNFLLAAHDSEGQGKLTVFSVKVMLAIMCAGKIVDKLRYIFSQISDANGAMTLSKFDHFLREGLKLPSAVFEGPSFGYTEHSAHACFPQQRLTVHEGLALEEGLLAKVLAGLLSSSGDCPALSTQTKPND